MEQPSRQRVGRRAWCRASWAGVLMACSVHVGVSLAQSSVPRVLYSNIAGSGTRTVPGGAFLFAPGTSLVDAFTVLACSPSGDRWAVRCRVVPVAGGAASDAIVTGTLDQTSGASGARVVLRTGDVSYISGRTWEAIGTGLGINDSGQVAMSFNISGSTSDDEVVARWTPGTTPTWATICREDAPALGQPAGVRFGPQLRSVHMLPSGLVGVQAGIFVNAPSLNVLYHLSNNASGTLLASSDTTMPAGQFASPSQLVSQFFLDRASTGSDGSLGLVPWSVVRLAGPSSTDQAIMRGTTILAQEGFVKPGSGFPSVVADFATMPAPAPAHASAVAPGGPGGEAMYFGSNQNGVDWASVWSSAGDTIVAQTGGPIVAGSAETWNDASLTTTFLGGAMNPTNVWVLAGKTNASSNANTVLVHESAGVVIREGDGVDLNGDNQANDNLFVGDIAQGSVQFGSNGRVYLIVQLRSPSGAIQGSALVRVPTPIGNVCDSIDFNNDGASFDPTDIDAFLSRFSEGPCIPSNATCNDIDFNNDNSTFDPVDIDSFLSVFGEGPCI